MAHPDNLSPSFSSAFSGLNQSEEMCQNFAQTKTGTNIIMT